MASTDEISLDADDGEVQHPPPLRRSRSSLRLISEPSRERTALRYLHAWIELYKPVFIERNAFPSDGSMPVPAACHDSGLAALGQLAALRMGVRRAFVTIMSRETEYVLVEATRSMSLQSDFTGDAKDKSWVGTACFARVDGINDAAIDGWRRARKLRDVPADSEHYYREGLSPHWCIVSDVSLEPNVRERPFVTRAQSPRFFFSIPLRDSDGIVIGSLSMIDDKPRYGVAAHEMLFCEDLGDTIAQHILGSTIAAQRQRSERLIQALGTFNNGGRSLKEWWSGQDNASMQRGGRRREIVHDDKQKDAMFRQEFGTEQEDIVPSRATSRSRLEATSLSAMDSQSRVPRSVSEGNVQAAQDYNINNISGHDFAGQSAKSPHAGGTKPQDSSNADSQQSLPQRERSKGAHTSNKDFDAATQVKDVYSRASVLLRESTGAAGIAFFDASVASAGRPMSPPYLAHVKPTEPTSPEGTNSSETTSSDESRLRATSDTDTSDNSERRTRLCKVVGWSMQVQAAEDQVRPSSLRLVESDLAKLLRAYPTGKVFNYAPTGTPYSGSDESAGSGSGGASSESATGVKPKSLRANTRYNRHARLLRKVVGDARSIAFYPIWDSSEKKYRSCLFAWTLHANRFFDAREDMTYLSAFGHSLRAEISRIETLASDVAKGKFISSISHELRSPLHGILAGVELLQDTQLTPFQEEMSLSVAIAGRTLLDTVNHILDYSKISNLTRDQKRDRTRLDAARHKSASIDESDKATLTVVDLARITEEVVESIISAHRFSESFERNTGNPKIQQSTSNDQETVSVILDIEKRDSWATVMTPGSWTRVLTNIVGNSLKYTPSGTVTIKLFATEDSTAVDGKVCVNLQIEDTGIGMSRDFVTTDMLLPFRQANSNSAGTGLGLSIVKEVIKEFNGSLDVQSEIGKGSCITTRFAAKFIARPDMPDNTFTNPLGPRARNLCMLRLSESMGVYTSPGTKNVAEGLERTASQWIGCNVTSSQGCVPNMRASVCVVSEDELSWLNSVREGEVKTLLDTIAATGSQLLIFGRSIASCQPEFSFEGFAPKPIYIHQPIGPRKLRRVLQYEVDSTATPSPSTTRSYADRSRTVKPTTIEGDGSRNRPVEGEPNSYFELPRDGKPRSPNSLITPISFMNASAKTPSPNNQQSKAAGERPSSDSDGDAVLLVEDNVINMRLLVALMKKQNLRHECAQDGLEALNKYMEDPGRYFLILMDMNMPVMDGFQSTAKIRAYERKNNLRAATITALTGVTNDEARTNAFNAGVNKYLTKPIQMKDLTKLVSETRKERQSSVPG